MPYQYVPAQPGQFMYQPQADQMRMAQYQQAQQPSPGIIWVQGEGGAKSYLIAPGASALLMDSEAQSFYIKSADPSGMPMPLRIFDYQERTAQAAPACPVQAPDYATRAELDELRAKLTAIEKSSARERASTIRKENSNGQSFVPAAQPGQ